MKRGHSRTFFVEPIAGKGLGLLGGRTRLLLRQFTSQALRRLRQRHQLDEGATGMNFVKFARGTQKTRLSCLLHLVEASRKLVHFRRLLVHFFLGVEEDHPATQTHPTLRGVALPFDSSEEIDVILELLGVERDEIRLRLIR